MRRTYRTLNDCEMRHNAEDGLFTRPSILIQHTYLSPLGNHLAFIIIDPSGSCIERKFPYEANLSIIAKAVRAISWQGHLVNDQCKLTLYVDSL